MGNRYRPVMKPRTPHPLRDPACNLCDIIRYGYFHQLRLLINAGLDLECKDSKRRTPIMLCALMEPESWGIGIARNLIENNVRLDKKDKFGRNVLHYACIYERIGLIQVLLKAMDFDLNQADKLGNTSLHYAALSGNITVTQIIARAFRRYKINPGKTNKRGFTAVEEATKTGYSKCSHVIEQEVSERRPGSALKDVRFADEVNTEHSVMRDQGSYFNPSCVLPSRKISVRPWSTSALVRRGSSASSISTEERLSANSYRSRSNLSCGGSYSPRKPYRPLVAMDVRHDDDVIHCAEAGDFRNKPDFVFKLVHLHYDASEWQPVVVHHSTNRSTTAWADAASSNQSQAILSLTDWRRDLKSLFTVYESQCSASWRAVQRAKAETTEEQERLAADMAEEDEKGKKPRRNSNKGNVGNNKEHVPDLKRRLSTTRMRRRSSIHGLVLGKLTGTGAGPGLATSMEGSLNTSTESINSLGTSNKRRGSDKELVVAAAAGGAPRSENAASRSGMRRSSVDRSSLSPSPTLIIPAITKPPPSSLSSTSAPSSVAAVVAAAAMKSNSSTPSSSSPATNLKQPIFKASSASELQNSAEETARPRGRKLSLINKTLTSLGRKDDDNGDKINRTGSKPDRRQTGDRNEARVTGSAGRKMAVPEVRESLVESRRISLDVTAKPDTSKLWVQNPYVDDEDDDIDDVSDYDDDDLEDESGVSN